VTIEPTEKLIKALYCAVAAMDGTAGGYSPREKQEARDEMLKLRQQLTEGWANEHKGC
jgi:hypothetical protein